MELRLTDIERARLDQLSGRPLPYPYWHQARNAFDRLSAPDLSLLGQYVESDALTPLVKLDE